MAALAAIELAQASGDLLVEAFSWQTLAEASPTSAEAYDAYERAVALAARGEGRLWAMPPPHLASFEPGRCTASPTRPCSATSRQRSRGFGLPETTSSACATPSPALVSQAKLGQVLIQAGRVDEGEHELAGCEQLLTLETTSWAARPVGLALGMLAFHRADYALAAAHYRKVYESSAADGTLHLAVVAGGALAEVLLTEGRQLEAEQVLLEMERMTHEGSQEYLPALWVRQARLHRIRGDLDTAEELLDRSGDTLDPGNAVERIAWYVERFAIATARGQTDLAQAYLIELRDCAQATGMHPPGKPPESTKRAKRPTGERLTSLPNTRRSVTAPRSGSGYGTSRSSGTSPTAPTTSLSVVQPRSCLSPKRSSTRSCSSGMSTTTGQLRVGRRSRTASRRPVPAGYVADDSKRNATEGQAHD